LVPDGDVSDATMVSFLQDGLPEAYETLIEVQENNADTRRQQSDDDSSQTVKGCAPRFCKNRNRKKRGKPKKKIEFVFTAAETTQETAQRRAKEREMLSEYNATTLNKVLRSGLEKSPEELMIMTEHGLVAVDEVTWILILERLLISLAIC